LIGLGGSGKTAVAARFLDDVRQATDLPRPDGLFVWSFYQQPDAGLFLQECYRYFTATGGTPARGLGLLHLLHEALAQNGPHLPVLDGLERVQQQGADAFGKLEDPLLRGLLERLATGDCPALVLVTSRFPLADLKTRVGHGYRPLEVDALDAEAAQALLRRRGVHGDAAALGRLIDRYGAHALTLDHLGGLIGQFLGGDPERAPELSDLSMAGGDRQQLRLARLLRAYEEHLPLAELTLLGRLCLLRHSVSPAQIASLFLCQPQVHAHTLRQFRDQVRACAVAADLFEPDDLADAVYTAMEEMLCAGPLAGPEDTLRQEARALFESGFDWQTESLDEVLAVARLYAGKEYDTPTDRYPLSATDRLALCYIYERVQELLEHPAMPYKDMPVVLEQSFQNEGYVNKPQSILSSGDVLAQLQRLRRRFLYVAGKHVILTRVRALCRTYQKKWTLAGPLAQLDHAGLQEVLTTLVQRHLVLRQADGSFSVHPAIRDHFYHRAAADGGAWHDLIREQLLTLARRPGRQRIDDPHALDLVEEAIFHALEAGRTDEAWRLFDDVLGGLRHLGWKLGEMNRGLRILRAFQPCPDRWALAWFLRALGELAEAYQQNELPYFRADIRLLQGRLPEVAAEEDEARSAIARFLMGQTTTLPPQPVSCPIVRDQLLLYLGRPAQVQQAALLADLYNEMGWEGDRARCQLLLAETARRLGDPAQARELVQAATRWILHSGSVEHLCLLHLVTARLHVDEGRHAAASAALSEGLLLARRYGLGLSLIELLNAQAELELARGNAPAAEQSAREACQRATAAQCCFLWGAAIAGHLLGQALGAQRDVRAARKTLRHTLALRRRIGDPHAETTAAVLRNL
ncbi:MAG TPA: hypothetical protein VFA18_24390, partial [Gemmataceae bacterium]|nr:hypothetical protein [Gemmataceae bacterium]